MKKLIIPVSIIIVLVGILLWPARMLVFEIYLTMRSSQESKQLVHKAVHGNLMEMAKAAHTLNKNSEKYEKDLKQIAKLFYLRAANKVNIEKVDALSKSKKEMPAGIEAERKFKLCILILRKNNHNKTLTSLHKELQNPFWFGKVNNPALLKHLDRAVKKAK